RDLDTSAKEVLGPSHVFYWLESGTAYCKARCAEPKRAYSAVNNDDSHISSSPSTNRGTNFLRRQVWIARPEHDRSIGCVLSIDPGICNCISVLHCQECTFHAPNYSISFVCNCLNERGVNGILAREPCRLRSGPYVAEKPNPVFGNSNNLARDRYNISSLETHALPCEGF